MTPLKVKNRIMRINPICSLLHLFTDNRLVYYNNLCFPKLLNQCYHSYRLHLESNQRVLCWFQNLQPLWREDNRAKGGKYKEEDKQDLIRRYNEENLS
mgnify:CR=1 FL=1